MTLTGATCAATGAAILADSSATVELDGVAVVGNATNGSIAGGGIRAGSGTTLAVRNSVFTNNSGYTGGAIYLDDSANFTVGASVFANNTARSTASPNYENIRPNTSPINEGNNLADNNEGDLFDTDFGDYIGAASYVVTTLVDSLYHTDDAVFRSVREAIDSANGVSSATIFVPTGIFGLTIVGSESGITNNDLDVTGDVTIMGVGAGLSVIDASGLNSDGVHLRDRMFEVTGSSAVLSLSGLTLTGATAAATGGAILANSNTTVELDRVAVVGNSVTGTEVGGGIRAGTGTTLTVRNSVFTDNSANVGGAIYADNGANLTVGATVFAKNSAGSSNPNVRPSTSPVNEGNNIADNNDGSLFGGSDYVGNVDYVVTSVADTLDHGDNSIALSLREAINLANQNSDEEIWVPGWLYRLTRVGSDDATLVGDLDILADMVVRGVDSGETTVDATLISEDVFDEIGALDFDVFDLAEVNG